MKKILAALTLSAAASFSANASYVQGVTGADLAGIEVTVQTATGGSESATWQATSATAGLAAGTSDWFITLDGDTFGDFDPVTGDIYGLFSFFSGALDVVSITLNMVGTGLVFDTEFGDASANGSGAGRELVSDLPQYSVSYSNLVEDELYSTLTLSGFIDAGSFAGFLTDVDAAAPAVPAPAGLALIGLGLLGMRTFRRTK